jgi:hypothetical protein
MTRKERKARNERWDKATLDDIIAMTEEEYTLYRIYVAKKSRRPKND